MKPSIAKLLTAFIPQRKLRRRVRFGLMLRELEQPNDHLIEIRYTPNPQSELAALCQKHGTDKGAIDSVHPLGGVHNYADYYEAIFGGIRNNVKNVLECGIGTINPDTPGTMAQSAMGGDGTYKPGASLRMWRDYFPNAQLVGLDVDEGALFTDDRIETYQCDQTDPQSIRAFAGLANRKFDIIIDDGLHTAPAAITFFDTIADHLSDTGIYVIEYMLPQDMERIAEHLARKHHDWHAQFVSLHRPNNSVADNSLVVITRR